jgi:hypothetical protein
MVESPTTKILRDNAIRSRDLPLDIPEQGEPSDDSFEDSHGDGRWSRHQVFAVQLIQENRNATAVTYASIHSPIEFNPSKGIKFTFEGIDGQWKVEIKGNNLERIYDRITSGKRESVRCNGQNVTAIEITKVDDD